MISSSYRSWCGGWRFARLLAFLGPFAGRCCWSDYVALSLQYSRGASMIRRRAFLSSSGVGCIETWRLRQMRTIAIVLVLLIGPGVQGALYSYTNSDGNYVVSQHKPAQPDIEYAVLTDEGEFVRLVRSRTKQIPIGHWRPWYFPKEPHHLDGIVEEGREPTPVVTVEEQESGEPE